MKIPTTIAVLLAGALGQAVPAAAQDMRPGLWTLDNQVGSPNGQVQAAMTEMRKQLAAMSPEQRQAMQRMMEQNGVQFDLGDNGALRTQMCMTPDMIARKEVPMQAGDCDYQMTPLGPNRLHVRFSCSKPRADGEGEMTIDTPTRYHAQMRIHSQDQPGQAVDMTVNGRWLSADCGAVRPIQLPPPK